MASPCIRVLIRSFLAILAIPVLPALRGEAGAADIVVVPGQSIQSAIATAAATGDRILVQPGVYPERIDTLGKTIEVIGVGGATVTTIDASGSPGSTVTLTGIYSIPTIIGFTITGGTGGLHPDGTFGGGGILDTSGSGARVRNCIVRDNHVVAGGIATGGGILSRMNGFSGAWTNIEDCVIEGNSSDGRGGGAAGYLWLRRCEVRSNSAPLGGGAYVVFRMENTRFLGNSAELGGGSYGRSLGSNSLTGLCRFEGNVASVEGGGMYMKSEASEFGSVLLSMAVFYGNSAPIGGGVSIHASTITFPPTLERCVFAQNTATSSSDGARIVSPGTILVRRCTFDGNRLSVSAGSAGTKIEASILRHPTPIQVDSGPVAVEACNVQNGYPGINNFNADPKFVEASALDHHLRADSTSVNHGPFALELLDFEGDAKQGSYSDTGADERAIHLDFAGDFAPGSPLTVRVHGNPGVGPVLLFVSTSLASTPVPTVAGPFRLGVPLLFPSPIGLGMIPASGALIVPTAMPANAPPGLAIHGQAWIGGTLSNAASLLVN